MIQWLSSTMNLKVCVENDIRVEGRALTRTGTWKPESERIHPEREKKKKEEEEKKRQEQEQAEKGESHD